VSEERRARIAELEAEAQKLKDEETAARRATHVSIVNNMTFNMGYNELLELRKVLDERISRQHNIECDDDE